MNAKNVLPSLWTLSPFLCLSRRPLWSLMSAHCDYRLYSLVVQLEDWLLFFNVITSVLSCPLELMWNALLMLVTSSMRKHRIISSNLKIFMNWFYRCWCLILTKQEEYFWITTNWSFLQSSGCTTCNISLSGLHFVHVIALAWCVLIVYILCRVQQSIYLHHALQDWIQDW